MNYLTQPPPAHRHPSPLKWILLHFLSKYVVLVDNKLFYLFDPRTGQVGAVFTFAFFVEVGR
jgi:hypothetical protein